MKFLLDSQISGQVAAYLRKAGHDVREVCKDTRLRGACDEVLVQTAWREGRVLVSTVRQFARLVSQDGSWRPGTILLVTGEPRPRVQIAVLQTLLERVPDVKLMTSLTLVEGHRARIYPLVAQPIGQVTPELQPGLQEPLSVPQGTPSHLSYLSCPVCGYTMKPLHGCKQVCPACGYLSSCSMD